MLSAIAVYWWLATIKKHVMYEFLERAEREHVVQQPKTYKSQHEQKCYITDIIEVL